MRLRSLAPLLLLAAIPSFAQQQEGPYVTVYRDDAVAFQVRRDRIKSQGDEVYLVWLRWLWAEPRTWKSDHETATIRIAGLDCAGLRVREYGALHKNRDGVIFDAEEWEDPPWKALPSGSGAEAAIARVCDFIPQLLESKRETGPRQE